MARLHKNMKLKLLLACCCIAASTQSGCVADVPETLRGLSLENGLAATWDFESGAAPQTFNGWSAQLASGTPHFVPGLHGSGVLVEEASRNLLAPTAADCTDAKAFEALHGAALAVEKNGELSTLHVRADGKTARSGVQAKAVIPTDDAGGWAVASLQIGGTGRVAVQLLDETNYVVGAPLYLDLKPAMTRVSPPPIEVVVPGGELRLRVTSVDNSPADFHIAQLQIEPLQVATSWMPGGSVRQAGALEYSLSHPTGNLQAGTLLVWAKPEWDNRTEPMLGSGKERQYRTLFSFRKGTTGPAVAWSVYGTLSSGSTLLGGVDMLHGGWHLIALTWQGKTGTMYFDGKTKDTGIVPIPNTATLTFGYIINATLDEAALLSTPLSKEALDKIFEAGQEKEGER
jgi:hypothetical protein